MGKSPIHRPMSIVTACVDRIGEILVSYVVDLSNCTEVQRFFLDIKPKALSSDMDLLMQGQVSWVGRSSMETSMDLLQKEPDGDWRHIINAKFVMVAQDPNTGRYCAQLNQIGFGRLFS